MERVLVDSYRETTPGEESALSDQVSACWTELSLLGPAEVITVGAQVRDDARIAIKRMAAVRHLSHIGSSTEEDEEREVTRLEAALNDLDEAVYDLRESLNGFALAASGALDDDGTRQLRRRRMRRQG